MLTQATGGSWYACAKAGIVGFTKNLACEQKGRVRVNCVAPGGRKFTPAQVYLVLGDGLLTLSLHVAIRTPRNEKFLQSGLFAKHLERNPSGRPGTATELANGVMFLLSPAASYINGHTMCIDGGLSVAE